MPVVDDSAPCNFGGWGTNDKRFSGVREPNFTKLGEDIGRSFRHTIFVSEVAIHTAGRVYSIVRLFQRSDILLHFQTRVAQS